MKKVFWNAVGYSIGCAITFMCGVVCAVWGLDTICKENDINWHGTRMEPGDSWFEDKKDEKTE